MVTGFDVWVYNVDDDGDEDKDVIILCSNPDRQWSLIVMDRPGRTAFEDTLGWL